MRNIGGVSGDVPVFIFTGQVRGVVPGGGQRILEKRHTSARCGNGDLRPEFKRITASGQELMRVPGGDFRIPDCVCLEKIRV